MEGLFRVRLVFRCVLVVVLARPAGRGGECWSGVAQAVLGVDLCFLCSRIWGVLGSGWLLGGGHMSFHRARFFSRVAIEQQFLFFPFWSLLWAICAIVSSLRFLSFLSWSRALVLRARVIRATRVGLLAPGRIATVLATLLE
jgi:hypothetical protein